MKKTLVRDLIQQLQALVTNPDSEVRVLDAATGDWLDVSAVRAHASEDEEGKDGDVVLCVDA